MEARNNKKVNQEDGMCVILNIRRHIKDTWTTKLKYLFISKYPMLQLKDRNTV